MAVSQKAVRIGVLAVILFMVLAVWGYSAYDQSRLKDSVDPIVETRADENASEEVDVASSVTVTRESVLWGAPMAKVEVYMRAKDGPAVGKITGIEYEYVLEDGEWRFMNSGACSGEECATRGRAAFEQ